MAEVERSIRALDKHAARHELFERADDFLIAAAACVAHGVGIERSAEHRGGSHDLCCQVAEGGEARVEQITDTTRDRPVGCVDAVAVERVEVLDDEERQATALPVETSAEVAVSAGAADKLGDVGGGEAAE